MADETKVIENVAERLRFFFSDANLRRDKFMRKELEDNEGKVAIETLLRFNSIKQYTEDAAIVAKAATHESVTDRIKLSEDEKSISRAVAFDPATQMNDNVQLSIRVTNLPTEEVDGEQKYKVSREDIKELFVKYGPVALINLHHHRSKRSSPSKRSASATGAAFVEFETVEAMEKASADLIAPADGGEDVKAATTLKLGDNELGVQTMQTWLDEKKNTPSKRKEAPPVEFKPYELEWEKGRVISIKGVPEGCDREKIFAAIGSFYDIEADDVTEKLSAYVDYSRGQSDAAIRFKEANDRIAELATKLADGGVKIADAAIASASILEGEEEDEYYKSFIAFKNKQRRNQAEEKQNKRRRSR
mmetsp:Transcript_34547/g.75933  ORF Transcript_34547/g.75933 Transcript_34547/m.75933 type:complete len:361 (-) Transcript_34547:85-1167(-)